MPQNISSLPIRKNERAARLGFLCLSDFGDFCEPLAIAVQDLTLSEDRRLEMGILPSQPVYKAAARQAAESLLHSMPEDLHNTAVSDAVTGPHDKAAARNLRDWLDTKGDAYQSLWGAYAALALDGGLIQRNGNTFRAICRVAWADAGCAKHPVSILLPCPDCSQPAPHAFNNQPSKFTAAWRLTCEGCGYEETWIPPLDASRWPAIEGELVVRQWVGANPGAAARLDARHPVRKSAMQALSTFAQNATSHLQLVADAAVQKGLTAFNTPSKSLGPLKGPNHYSTFSIYANACAFWASEVEAGVVAPPDVKSRGSSGSSPLDQALGDLTSQQLSLKAVELTVTHPAQHWKAAYEERLARLQAAVTADDAIEATVQALLFKRDLEHNGLLSRVGLDCALPLGVSLPRPLGQHSGTPSLELLDVLPACNIDELAQYLRNHSSGADSLLAESALRTSLLAFAQILRQRAGSQACTSTPGTS